MVSQQPAPGLASSVWAYLVLACIMARVSITGTHLNTKVAETLDRNLDLYVPLASTVHNILSSVPRRDLDLPIARPVPILNG